MPLYFAKLTVFKRKNNYLPSHKKKTLEQRTFDHATTYTHALKTLMVFKNGELYLVSANSDHHLLIGKVSYRHCLTDIPTMWMTLGYKLVSLTVWIV